MPDSRAGIVCAVLMTSMAAGVTAQNWDAYRPGRLATVIEQHDSAMRADFEGAPVWSVSGASFPTRATVEYVGDHRAINPLRRELIRRWAVFIGQPESIAEVFEQEYLFREDGHELWLPVQREVASFFPAELQPGGRVTLFVAWVGAHYAGDEITWTFIVNEFDASVRKPPNSPSADDAVFRRKVLEL